MTWSDYLALAALVVALISLYASFRREGEKRQIRMIAMKQEFLEAYARAAWTTRMAREHLHEIQKLMSKEAPPAVLEKLDGFMETLDSVEEEMRAHPERVRTLIGTDPVTRKDLVAYEDMRGQVLSLALTAETLLKQIQLGQKALQAEADQKT